MNITSLPDDVLCDIIERAIFLDVYGAWDEHSKRKSLSLTKESPLNVSHTCRAWRQLALSNARYWSRLIQALKEQYHLKADIRMFSLFLERSANAILDFSASWIYDQKADFPT